MMHSNSMNAPLGNRCSECGGVLVKRNGYLVCTGVVRTRIQTWEPDLNMPQPGGLRPVERWQEEPCPVQIDTLTPERRSLWEQAQRERRAEEGRKQAERLAKRQRAERERLAEQERKRVNEEWKLQEFFEEFLIAMDAAGNPGSEEFRTFGTEDQLSYFQRRRLLRAARN